MPVTYHYDPDRSTFAMRLTAPWCWNDYREAVSAYRATLDEQTKVVHLVMELVDDECVHDKSLLTHLQELFVEGPPNQGQTILVSRMLTLHAIARILAEMNARLRGRIRVVPTMRAVDRVLGEV